MKAGESESREAREDERRCGARNPRRGQASHPPAGPRCAAHRGLGSARCTSAASAKGACRLPPTLRASRFLARPVAAGSYPVCASPAAPFRWPLLLSPPASPSILPLPPLSGRPAPRHGLRSGQALHRRHLLGDHRGEVARLLQVLWRRRGDCHHEGPRHRPRARFRFRHLRRSERGRSRGGREAHHRWPHGEYSLSLKPPRTPVAEIGNRGLLRRRRRCCAGAAWCARVRTCVRACGLVLVACGCVAVI